MKFALPTSLPARVPVRQEAPRAPVEIQEAVELYAREHGRTGRIEFKPEQTIQMGDRRFRVGLNCWEATFSLKPNDKRMLAWQQGLAEEPPTESVLFMEANPDCGKPDGRGGRQGQYRALDIYQMGAAGVRAFLDRTNTWSGRGEYLSVADAVRTARDGDAERNARRFEGIRDDVKARAREEHVWYDKRPHEKIARQSVITDLTPNP